jgi:hypothetical protein
MCLAPSLGEQHDLNALGLVPALPRCKCRVLESVIEFAVLTPYSNADLPPHVDHLWFQHARSLEIAKAAWKNTLVVHRIDESHGVEYVH